MRYFSQKEIEEMLSLPVPTAESIFDIAKKIKEKVFGSSVYLRAIVEVSNICDKNCFYCGIRRGNKRIKRYRITVEEIIKCVEFAVEKGIYSVVLQGGEVRSEDFVFFVEDTVKRIKKRFPFVALTLSFGEQDLDVYKRWFYAGAERYLLRIETSDSTLYRKLHPYDHSFSDRINCLYALKKIGYQTGTGILIGVPFQTISHLANDILFFKNSGMDMIGMGPYILHPDTPFGKTYKEYFEKGKDFIGFNSLKVMAVTRIVLKNINIASTTALDALMEDGRVKGLLAGANVIMPDITPLNVKKDYVLYQNKPDLHRPVEDSLKSVFKIIRQAGFSPALNDVGTSPYFLKRSNT